MSCSDWLQVYRQEIRQPVDLCHDGHSRERVARATPLRRAIARIRRRREKIELEAKIMEFSGR